MGEFGNLTVFIDEENEPWFYGNEIAEKLGYSSPQHAVQQFVNQSDMKIISRKSLEIKALNESFKALSINKLWKNENDFNDKILINEPALYKLTFRSKLPNAEAFTDKVTHEILPTIRKTGAYMTKETLAELENNPRKMAELYNKLADMQEAKKKTEAENKRLTQINNMQDAQLTIINNSIASDDCLPVNATADLLHKKGVCEMGRNDLYLFMKDLGMIFKTRDRYYLPTKKFINNDMMTYKIEPKIYTNRKGAQLLKEWATVYIKPKGIRFIASKIYEMNKAASYSLF